MIFITEISPIHIPLNHDAGFITMQSSQRCAVHDAICAVQDEKLCSPKITKINVILCRKFAKLSNLRSLLYWVHLCCFENGQMQSTEV